jgi:serine/threonine-protein kinase
MAKLGRYEIVEQLGQGSMGIIYKARDPILSRDVAIKKILVQSGESPEADEFRERLFREARAAARLSHPGIVTVFDVGEHEGDPFIVMEYVSGRTLLSVLQSGERLSLDRACDMGIQLAEALDYAHRNGVIHRDIKPANILITSEGRIKIADFGVAKLIESELTAKGMILGTPAFMAPEQFTGIPLDRRADLFSAGVVIYYMVTGEKPFSGDSVAAIQYKVIHTDPVEPRKLNPAVSERLDAAILKSIRKDPLQRYPSGEELARDLRLCLVDAPASKTADAAPTNDQTTVLLPSSVGRGARSPRRLRDAVVVSGLITAFFFASIAFYPAKNSQRKAPAAADPTPQAITTSVLPATPEPLLASEPARTESSNEVLVSDVVPEPNNSTKRAKPTTAGKLSVPIEVPKVVPAPQQVDLSAAASSPAESAANYEPDIGSIAETAQLSPTLPQPVEQLEKKINEPIAAPVRQESATFYGSAQLLISSASVPNSLAIMVTVDNEILFNSDNGSTLSAPASLSEVRSLPPGRHKLQVYAMLGNRRVAKVQEVSDRFYPGKRRILEIEFLPESQVSRGWDPRLFKITLK